MEEKQTPEVKLENKPVKKAPVKKVKKSKVGKFYKKIVFLEKSTDQDQTAHFKLNGASREECVISLPDSAARILNRSTPYSGVKYVEVK